MSSEDHAPRFQSWIAAYEQAWRTPGTAPLAALFAPDASYRPAPFDDPITGLDAIARFWEQERAGPDEAFTLAASIVVAGPETGVARVQVTYGDPARRVYRDLWVITLGADGRCAAFEEWPFFPGQPRASG